MSKPDKPRRTGALGRVALDPVVQQELARQEQAEKRRHMSPAQRRRARADARRSKATFDMPPELIEALGEIAQSEDISKSDLVAELLIRAVNDYHAGRLVLDNDKEMARALKWAWKLVLSTLDAGLTLASTLALRWPYASA